MGALREATARARATAPTTEEVGKAEAAGKRTQRRMPSKDQNEAGQNDAAGKRTQRRMQDSEP